MGEIAAKILVRALLRSLPDHCPFYSGKHPLPAVAINAPNNINAAANTAGKSGTSAPAKDSDDKSFSDFLTEQTPDKIPDKASDKTDTAPKAKSADTKAANPPAGKSVQVSIAKNTKAPADAKSGGKKSDDVKQDQSDTQTDSTDTVPAPDTQLASNVVQQPLLLPADAGDQDDDSNGNHDAGNQTGQPGKDIVPAADAAPAPDTSAPPQLPQINNDAMAAAANQAAAANVPASSAPVPPPTIATAGIDATQKGPRPRIQPPVQADATAPQTVADSNSDTDSTPADAPAPVTAGAAPQAPVATAQNSQDDDSQDSDDDGASTPDITVPSAVSANPPAPQTPAPAPAVAPPPHTRAPRTVTAQNDTQPATETAPADIAPAKTAPPINQPQGIANADNAGQTPSASQTPKPGTSDFKVASAKDSDSQTQDTRSTADTSVSAPPAPQAPQAPAPARSLPWPPASRRSQLPAAPRLPSPPMSMSDRRPRTSPPM